MKRYLVGLAGLAILYYATAEVGLSLHGLSDTVSMIWAPTAIGVAITLLYGPRWLPALALGTFAVIVVREKPIWAAVLITTNDVLEVVAGYLLLRDPTRFRPQFDRVRDVFVFVATAVAISLGSATLSALELVYTGQVPQARLASLWTTWWWSHLSGLLIVMPAILTWARPTSTPRNGDHGRPLEVFALAIASLAVVVLVLGRQFPAWFPGFNAPYYLLPLLLWAGLRFGPRGAATATFGTSVTAIVAQALGLGPFYTLSDLQSFVTVSTVTTLLLSALALERVRAVQRKGALQVTALDAIVTMDDRGTIVEMNPAAERLFLVPEAQAIGKDVASVMIPPRLRHAFRERLCAYRDGAKPLLSLRYRTTAWRAVDNREFPVEIAVTRVPVEGPFLFTGFVRDLSAEQTAQEQLEQRIEERTAELRQANRQLEYRETLMRQAEALAHLGSFDYDVLNNKLEWSDETFCIYGRDKDTFEPTCRSWLDAIHPDDRASVEAELSRVLRTARPFRHEARILRPDGSMRNVRMEARVLSDGKQPVRVIGCCQDTTEQRQGDVVRSRLAQIVEATDDAIIGLSPDAKIETWNPAAETLFGITAEEIDGHFCLELVPQEFHAELLRILENVRSGNHVSHYEIPHVRRDGSAFDGSVTMSAVFDPAGNVVGIAKILRDVTNQKSVENQLRLSLNEKEVLLREIHHRVKNNLQVITSLLNIQVHAEQTVAARKGLIESQHRIQSMALVHQLLYQSKDLARIDFGEYLRTLANRLLSTYAVDPNRITLVVSSPQLRLDIDRAIPCGLIVNELLTNALAHAFPDGRSGRIEVRLESWDHRVRLSVADNGVGLPPGLVIDDVQTFGLQIARTLAHQLDGTLQATTDLGTTFHVEFPLGPPARDSRPDLRKSPPTPRNGSSPT